MVVKLYRKLISSLIAYITCTSFPGEGVVCACGTRKWGLQSASMRGETYGKLPTQLSAIMLLRTHSDSYGPTFDVASVKLQPCAS
jgi:hypothetical protein